MNTSHTSRSLSAEQLEAFLEGKLPPDEMQRVQHLLDDCELSREALEGYAIVPGAFADVEGLKKAIAAKSGMSWTWGKIGWSVMGVAVISVLVTWFYPADETALAENEPAEVQQQQVIPKYTEPVNSLSPKEDHFVNPEAKVVPVVNSEPKVNANGDIVVASTEPEFVVEPIPAEEHEHLITDSVRPVEPKKKEIIYNAPVGFIVDLKVTEYDSYYATPVEVRELKLTGTPAKYETEDGIGDSREEKDEEPVRMVPADQFLREGLIAFRDGRYGKCISKMEVLLDKNPNDINALFYTAVSYVKLEMYSKAIPLLDQIIDADNNVFDEEAEWYKALALEGNGDDAAAQELFRKIADDGGFYSRQATLRLR